MIARRANLWGRPEGRNNQEADRNRPERKAMFKETMASPNIDRSAIARTRSPEVVAQQTERVQKAREGGSVMKLQVVVGNYRGLTDEVKIFLDDEQACEEVLDILRKTYGLSDDPEAPNPEASSISVYTFDVEVISLVNIKVQEDNFGIGGEVVEKTIELEESGS